MVLIRWRTSESDPQKVCGGTLISDTWVLSAAHCIHPVVESYRECNKCLELYMGIHDYTLAYALEPHRKQLLVRQIVIHEEFELVGNWNDLALIEVEKVDIVKHFYYKIDT